MKEERGNEKRRRQERNREQRDERRLTKLQHTRRGALGSWTSFSSPVTDLSEGRENASVVPAVHTHWLASAHSGDARPVMHRRRRLERGDSGKHAQERMQEQSSRERAERPSVTLHS